MNSLIRKFYQILYVTLSYHAFTFFNPNLSMLMPALKIYEHAKVFKFFFPFIHYSSFSFFTEVGGAIRMGNLVLAPQKILLCLRKLMHLRYYSYMIFSRATPFDYLYFFHRIQTV